MSVTTAIVLDARRKNKETKNYPVVLRMTFQRRSRTYPLGVQLSKSDFKLMLRSKPDTESVGKWREIKEKLEKEQQRTQNILNNINNFSFHAFAEQFTPFQSSKRRQHQPMTEIVQERSQSIEIKRGHVLAPVSRRKFVNQFGERKYPREKSKIDFKALGGVAVFYGIYIKKLESKDQAGTVSNYVSSLMSMLRHQPQLRFSDVTDMWLYEYEKFMKSAGRSITTISMYVRCLRRIFNYVISKKIISRDLYPFGRDLYVVPGGRKRKKALKMPDIQALWEYHPKGRIRRMAKDLWFFMYVGNGMNVKDMCLAGDNLLL